MRGQLAEIANAFRLAGYLAAPSLLSFISRSNGIAAANSHILLLSLRNFDVGVSWLRSANTTSSDRAKQGSSITPTVLVRVHAFRDPLNHLPPLQYY